MNVTRIMGTFAASVALSGIAFVSPASAGKPTFWVDHAWNGTACNGTSTVTFTYHWSAAPHRAAQANINITHPGGFWVTSNATLNLALGSVSVTSPAVTANTTLIGTGDMYATRSFATIGRTVATDTVSCP